MKMEVSSYFTEKLSDKPRDKKRYMEKINKCQLKKDPYAYDAKEFDRNPAQIPNIRQCDLSCYMVHTPSSYTREETKAFKAMLGADSFVQAGWVHDMRQLKYSPDGASSPRYLVIGNVKHSQSMNATFCHPWFVAEEDGEIQAAHCDCMAGLGESCSHIAAIISAVARAVYLRTKSGADACTSQLCIWLPPSKNCTPAKVKTINFTSPSAKRRLEESPTVAKRRPTVHTERIPIPPSTDEEIATLYATLNQCKTKPGILRVLDDYSHNFVPIYEQPKYPKSLSSLYESTQLKTGYLALLSRCETVFDTIKVSTEEVRAVEKDTRDQAASKLWHYQRTGRITASNFKAAARTDPTWPSESLIKRLTHPEDFSFSTEATRWGCEHEDTAIKAYLRQQAPYHPSIEVEPSGFVISKEYPFIGASPDGWVFCECCGVAIIEVKCPFSCKDKLPEDNSAKNFCMKLVDGQWVLDKNHQYFYQVQTQLFVTKKPFCDFIVWSQGGILVQRIYRDDEFFMSHLPAVTHFFKYSVLPELVGKWVTRQIVSNVEGIVEVPEGEGNTGAVTASEGDTDAGRLWCYCEQPSTDELVTCDNKQCTILRFHMGCLRLRCPPNAKKNSKWYCPSCRKLPKFSRSKKGKK
ncbi:uncharacterized protein [Amphiura filiformis]|uniref:uncharacterized protein n=1 Tax=Amphiura filiformis TaxID=82378 RepID=UPI003B21F74F